MPVAYQSNKVKLISTKKKVPEFSIGQEIRWKEERYDNKVPGVGNYDITNFKSLSQASHSSFDSGN